MPHAVALLPTHTCDFTHQHNPQICFVRASLSHRFCMMPAPQQWHGESFLKVMKLAVPLLRPVVLSGSAGSGGITRQQASEPSPPKPSVTIKNHSGLAHGQWPLHNSTALPLLCCTCTSLWPNLMHCTCPAWLLLGPWHLRGGTFR